MCHSTHLLMISPHFLNNRNEQRNSFHFMDIFLSKTFILKIQLTFFSNKLNVLTVLDLHPGVGKGIFKFSKVTKKEEM